MFRVSLSIKNQLGVGFVLLVVASLLLTAGVLIYLGSQAELRQLVFAQQERSRATATEINAYIDDLQRKLGYLARVRGLSEMATEQQRDLLEGLTRHNSAYETVAILDADGKVVASAETVHPIGRDNFADDPFFVRAFIEATDYVGPVEVDPEDQLVEVTLAVPIRDKQDRVAGVLLAKINLKFLWFIVSRVQVEETGYAYIIDDHHNLIVEKGGSPENFHLVDLSDRPFIENLISGNADTLMTYRGLRDVDVLGAISPISTVNWYVIVELPTDEAYAPIRTMLYAMGVALVLAVGAAVALGLLFSRQIVAPLGRLTDAAAQISAGNLDTRVKVLARNELGILARTFNEMITQLQELYTNLEQRVVERTCNLEQEIAERRQVEQALRKSEERYALAVRGANDGLWDWDLKSNQVHFSQRWKSMLGCTEDDVSTSPNEWFDRVHPDDLAQFKTSISRHLEGLTPHFENEHRILHKDGHYRWVLSRGLGIRDNNQIAHRMAGSLTDITVRKQAEEQLAHGAFHDALTGLPNRALLAEYLHRALARTKRHEDYMFAVLFLDLDRFKVINDSLGHTIGDQLLIAVARRLETCMRATDTLARLGGDEFVLLLADSKDISDAIRVAERIEKEFSEPFNLHGHQIFISASIGIILSKTGYESSEDILRDADIALYRAKALGKARHAVFDPTMRTRAVTRLELENDLRRAIANQEFVNHYQPIVVLETGRIVSFEALVRWQHPTRGLLSPSEFMSIADETGLIVPIGWWVLQEACRQLSIWQKEFPAEFPLNINVNLCSKQFAQPGLAKRIHQILKQAGINAHCLRLEITETTIIENVETTRNMLSQLQAMGVQIQIDDFGTGYSSLSYLHQLPINTIKIDRTFIRQMSINGNGPGIVQTIVALARNLGMEVVAEGLETSEQLYKLKTLKCEYGQGFIFFRPVDSRVATGYLQNHNPRN